MGGGGCRANSSVCLFLLGEKKVHVFYISYKSWVFKSRLLRITKLKRGRDREINFMIDSCFFLYLLECEIDREGEVYIMYLHT